MTIDCGDVPSNITYDCANPWGEDCISKAKFQFTSLWGYTQKIQAACANDTRLFLPDGSFATAEKASLTQESCLAITGMDWTDWTRYPTPDIWNRLTTWKFPLLQLVASFPRPPLSFTVECFVILHLLGDPINTIKNLIFKMSTCQRTATDWKRECNTLLESRVEGNSEEDRDRNWKALAMITDAYGEWDKSGLAQAVLHEALIDFADNPLAKSNLMTAVRQTGRALAADRATKSLPIVVAQTFFIAAVGIAVFRTAASAGHRATSDTVFINIEAHSIAFSALYFWIIPAVFLSAIIGVSQTEAAIPRILRRFQIDLDRQDLPRRVQMPKDCLKDDEGRIYQGGVYSWQPLSWRSQSLSPSISPKSQRKASPYQQLGQDPASLDQAPSGGHSAIAGSSDLRPSDCTHTWLPYPILILGTVTGLIVSGYVPPDGFDCRHLGEILICTAWILSAQADTLLNYLWPLSSGRSSTLFWMTAGKDLLMTVATMGGIIVTQIGIFNRCSCYTLWGRTGLALPERPDIAATLFHRLNTLYPAVTFTGIGLELVIIPLYFCYRYRDAIRVFVQRDDRRSNAAWLWKAHRKLQVVKQSLSKVYSRLPLDKWKPRRSGTSSSAAERGAVGRSMELQTPLTRTISEEPEGYSASEANVVDQAQESTLPITSISQSESSSVQPPLPSGTTTPSRLEPRRRNTEPQWDTEVGIAMVTPPQADRSIHRKPLPTVSPLQRSQ